jgi:hypothetical protein
MLRSQITETFNYFYKKKKKKKKPKTALNDKSQFIGEK